MDFLNTECEPQKAERDAAWELFVEMLTRIVTQPLAAEDGDEKTALDNVRALFGITGEILRRCKGRDCIQISKIAIIVLNQIVRPITAKWPQLALAGAFEQIERHQEFRHELEALQGD